MKYDQHVTRAETNGLFLQIFLKVRLSLAFMSLCHTHKLLIATINTLPCSKMSILQGYTDRLEKSLKVHKRENFFGSKFEFVTIL